MVLIYGSAANYMQRIGCSHVTGETVAKVANSIDTVLKWPISNLYDIAPARIYPEDLTDFVLMITPVNGFDHSRLTPPGKLMAHIRDEGIADGTIIQAAAGTIDLTDSASSEANQSNTRTTTPT